MFNSIINGCACEWMSSVLLHNGNIVNTYKIALGRLKGKRIYRCMRVNKKYRRRLNEE